MKRKKNFACMDKMGSYGIDIKIAKLFQKAFFKFKLTTG